VAGAARLGQVRRPAEHSKSTFSGLRLSASGPAESQQRATQSSTLTPPEVTFSTHRAQQLKNHARHALEVERLLRSLSVSGLRDSTVQRRPLSLQSSILVFGDSQQSVELLGLLSVGIVIAISTTTTTATRSNIGWVHLTVK
jgi:hypothetical protein